MSRSRTLAWFSWMIASIFYAYQYILRVMPNIMMHDIMQQFNMDALIFGQFSGIYYIFYSLMHLPIGIMLDRFGPKKVMTSCIMLTVAGLLPIIFAEHWVYPILGRALIGIGSSAAILGTFKIIRMTFSEKHFTRMLSLSVTIGLIGAIYGGAPVSYLATTLGYKGVVEIFAGLGMVLAALTYMIVPEGKSTHQGSVMSDIQQVFTNKKVILLCLFAGLMVGPLEGFADVWATIFLKKVYGFETGTASYIPSMIFVGMCFGAPALSFIAEKTGSYLGAIIGAGFIMLVIFIALITGILNVNTMTLGFIVVGVCCAYQILAIYKASTYVNESVAGLTTAVANMIIMSFGYAFHTVIGFFVHTYGSEQAISYLYGIGVIPVALSLGIAGFVGLSLHDRKIFTKSNERGN